MRREREREREREPAFRRIKVRRQLKSQCKKAELKVTARKRITHIEL